MNILKANVNENSIEASHSEQENASIQMLINNFWYFEKQCDQVTEDLESKAKEIVRRVEREAGRQRMGRFKIFDGLNVPLPDCLPELNFHPSNLNKEQFKHRAELARKFCVPYRIVAGNKFIDGATDEELQELEDFEMEVQLLQFQLRSCEDDILESVPDNAENAIAKLKFISTLLIDGCHIDIDHFAFLVKESSEIIDSGLDSILRTYRKHKELLD